MQSATDCATSFSCTDCKAQYTSASTLLKHFAQHFSYSKKEFTSQNLLHNVGAKQNHTLSSNIVDSEEENKTESILEQVLRQSLSKPSIDGSPLESNSLDSSSASDHGTYISENNKYFSEEECHLPQTFIGSRDTDVSTNNVMLIKFDLQKRLENCIFKLVSKKDSNSEITSKPIKVNSDSVTSSQNTWEPTGRMQSQELTVTHYRNNTDIEDFNPLKFCLVTMDEEDEKLELETTNLKIDSSASFLKSHRQPSNRKQRSPKKIQNHMSGKAEMLMDGLKIDTGEKKTQQIKKKYPCQICWKVFGWSTDLKRHIITHTGERPFCCQMCPANFTRNFLLQKHELKVHPTLSINGIVIDKIAKVDRPTDNDQVQLSKMKETEHLGLAKHKRKIQRTNEKKQMVNDLEKTLNNLNRCNSISYKVFTPKALNIL